MKIKSIFFSLLLLIIAVACTEDSSTEPDTAAVEQVESELRELDQMFFKVAGSQMIGIVNEMPEGLIDLSGILGLQKSMIPGSAKSNLSSLQKTANDTSIIDLIGQLINLFGTHTWDGTQWQYADSPSDEVIIIFPYQNQTSGTEQTVKVRLYNLTLTNTTLSLSAEVLVDDVKTLSFAVNISASNLFIITGNPEIISLTAEGTILDNDGTEYSYSASVTDIKVETTFGPTGENYLTIEVEVSGFISNYPDTENANITKVTIKYGLVTIIIDDPTAEEGDIGDVFYEGNKVADLVIKEDGQLYIIYIDDEEKLFSQVMTSYAFISLFD